MSFDKEKVFGALRAFALGTRAPAPEHAPECGWRPEERRASRRVPQAPSTDPEAELAQPAVHEGPPPDRDTTCAAVEAVTVQQPSDAPASPTTQRQDPEVAERTGPKPTSVHTGGMGLRPPTPPPGCRRSQQAAAPAVAPTQDAPPPPSNTATLESFSTLSNPLPPSLPLRVGVSAAAPTTAPVAAAHAASLAFASPAAPVRSLEIVHTPMSLECRWSAPQVPLAQLAVRDTGWTAPSAEARTVVLPHEDLFRAFGQALQVCMQRHESDVLESVLGMQQEHLSVQRKEYGDALERAIQRLATELSPESIIGVGEIFRISAGEITGAIRRGEHLSGKILATLKDLNENVASLVACVVNALAAPALIEQPATPPRRVPRISTNTGDRNRGCSVLHQLSEDDDNGDDDDIDRADPDLGERIMMYQPPADADAEADVNAGGDAHDREMV